NGAYQPALAYTIIVPVPDPEYDSSARPIIYPEFIAFTATPGVEPTVSGSPTEINPFSVLTFVGTLPFKAIGYIYLCTLSVLASELSVRPGAVETTPSKVLDAACAFTTA